MPPPEVVKLAPPTVICAPHPSVRPVPEILTRPVDVVAVLAATFSISPVVTIVPVETKDKAVPVVRPFIVMSCPTPVVAKFAVIVITPVPV
jgi:hypothetical protein